MIDHALDLKIPRGIVVADAGYGNISRFREELEKRSLFYVVGIESTAGV
jgi:SRSO17 transposase